MDGSGDAQGQNDISDSFFAGSQVGLEGTIHLNMSCIMRKPFFAYAKTKTQISCTVTAQLIFATRIIKSLYFLIPKFQASSHLYVCTAWFVSDMVGNPEDWFSHNKAHMSYIARKHVFRV